MMTIRADNLDIIKNERISISEMQPYLDIFSKTIKIPTSYQFHSVSKVKADNVAAYLFRFEKDVNKGLMGEHYSFIVSENERQILGFTNMDVRYSNLNMLSKSETEKIARDFLLKLDGTLANDLKNLWIERHDEEILVDGEKTILAGMKYKCYRSSRNDYTWVIVGFDGSIITFERNIRWNTIEHKRFTEKWLHDSWVLENT